MVVGGRRFHRRHFPNGLQVNNEEFEELRVNLGFEEYDEEMDENDNGEYIRNEVVVSIVVILRIEDEQEEELWIRKLGFLSAF